MFYVIAGAIALSATPTASGRPDARVNASYDSATDRYCLRLKNPDATLPAGLGLYRRICRTQAAWASDGVTIERRQLAGR